MDKQRSATITQALMKWREGLELSRREQSVLGPELQGLDRQLNRLQQRQLRVAVFGRVGVGKSSLINALIGDNELATDVAHGSTRRQQAVNWNRPWGEDGRLQLVDTPGIDEIAAPARERLARRVATGSDLVLMVLDGDISAPELAALKTLQDSGKPVLLVANRADTYSRTERRQLCESIQHRSGCDEPLLWVAAAPRQPVVLADGRVRRQTAPPQLGALQQHLDQLLGTHGELLLALNSLRAADHFSARLLAWRLDQRQQAAQALIGRCASIKAAGLAANPLLLLDLAGSAAVDSTLIVQLAQLYGVRLRGPSARRLLQRVGRQSLVIGGVQWGLQGALSLIKQVLLMAAPFSGGLSLAPAAPVAVAQAALAVHGTRITGREAARQLLLSAHRGPSRPASLLRRLQRADPQAQRWLAHHQPWSPEVGLP
tara:strand:- start:1674 stop:2963 length:1290 start_codon:yes stop_codon:yes gene_type:complete